MANKFRDALATECGRTLALLSASEPFALLGGGPDMQAFHDMPDDAIVWENSGHAVTAGECRQLRRVIAMIKNEPVSEMHFRRGE